MSTPQCSYPLTPLLDCASVDSVLVSICSLFLSIDCSLIHTSAQWDGQLAISQSASAAEAQSKGEDMMTSTQVHNPEAVRQKGFDALYRGDVEAARAILVIEGAREAPAAVLQRMQQWQQELATLRAEKWKLQNEVWGLERKVRHLEEQLNPEEPEDYCSTCGQPV